MKWNTKQVAEKLGVGLGAVRNMASKNLIHDISIRKPNAKKHFAWFDSKEINEFAKSYKKRSRSNGSVTQTFTVKENAPQGIMSRLERLEKKVDKLIAMWS